MTLGTIRITTARGLVKSVKGEKRKTNVHGGHDASYDNFIFETKKDYDAFKSSRTCKNKYSGSTFYSNAGGFYWISLFKKE